MNSVSSSLRFEKERSLVARVFFLAGDEGDENVNERDKQDGWLAARAVRFISAARFPGESERVKARAIPTPIELIRAAIQVSLSLSFSLAFGIARDLSDH